MSVNGWIYGPVKGWSGCVYKFGLGGVNLEGVNF